MLTTEIREWPEPLPELGNLILSQRAEIMEAWERLVEQKMPSCDRTMHRVALRNHLPQYLDKLAQDMIQGREGKKKKTPPAAQEHGVVRWRQGWELELVIRDYQLLFHAILVTVRERIERPFTTTEVVLLTELLHESTIIAIRTFLGFRPEESELLLGSDLNDVLNSCRDAIIELAIDGSIRRWNHGAERAFGYPASEVVGSHLSILVPPERRFELDHCMIILNSGREVIPFDTIRRKADGTEISVSVSASPIRDQDGNLKGFVEISRDITSRVQAADVLRGALEEAERGSRAKSEFLANVSHELRTPMNAIIGMTELALEEELSPELNDYLQTTLESAQVLLNLVNDVLDISKLESGKFTLDAVSFSLRDLLEETIRGLGSQAYRKGLEIVLKVAGRVPDALHGDPLRLRQVVTNLVGNAIKFTDEGEIIVEVELEATTRRSCVLRFSVSDTGIGIGEEDQQQIFAPFMQGDASSTRRFAGTGLGLAIAGHLINCLHGQFWVQSELGVGSIFYFTARFTLADSASEISKAEKPSVEQLQGMAVLVADDNESNREILRYLLSGWKMRPLLAADASAAKKLLEEYSEEGNPIPLAIIDGLMPDKDGFELIEEMSSRDEFPTKWILMLSSADRLAFRERCHKLNVDGFLEKPISHSNLRDAIFAAMKVATFRSAPVHKRDYGAPTHSLEVLLVEDTPANRKIAELVLQKRGHQVTVANNGREAIDLFSQKPFDVVLMDVQMPIMDGLQATEAIRIYESENKSPRHIPIIAMTAHAMDGDRQRCLAVGMDDYLSKPINIRQLVELVETYGNAGSSTNSEAPSDEPSAPAPARFIPSTAPQSDDAPLSDRLDLEQSLARLGGDEELLLDIIDFYIEDYPGLLSRMEEALSTKKTTALERAAHSMKGLSANFDATQAVKIAGLIEEAAKERNLAKAGSFMKEMHHLAKELAEQLDVYRQSKSTKTRNKRF